MQHRGLLNREWFVLTNESPLPFNFGGCVVAVDETANSAGRPSNRDPHHILINPGVMMAPGGSVRIVTGQIANPNHGIAPRDACPNYFLERGAPWINNEGDSIRIFRGEALIAWAEFAPWRWSGIGRHSP